jgi:hypothetical protein
MKNSLKIFGIITLAVVVGLSTTGCPSDDSGSNEDGPAFLGDRLELSGQVYTEKWNDSYTSLSYQKYTGNLAINDYYGGNGEIKNGNLSFSIGTPDYLHTLDLEDKFGWNYDNLTLSNQNVKGTLLFDPNSGSSIDYSYPRKTSQTISISGTKFSQTFEGVVYVYVDKDVTVSGKGKEEKYDEYGYDEYGYKETYTTKNFSLALKAGWNAVYTKVTGSGSFTGPIDDPTSVNITSIETMSLGNPSLKWVLEEDRDYKSVSMSRSMPKIENQGFTTLRQKKHNRLRSE